MLVNRGQYVNIHAHRLKANPGEWVLTDLDYKNYLQGKPGDRESFFSIGLHPWKIKDADIMEAMHSIQLATEDLQVIAIGEAGIDKTIDTPLDLQINIFSMQLEIAEAVGIPMIIHAVRAYQELITFIKEQNPSVPMIIHGYTGGTQLAESLLKAGFMLSFGARTMESEKIMEAASQVPLQMLFLETDESEMNITNLYKAVAYSRKMNMQDLVQHMIDKTNSMFYRDR